MGNEYVRCGATNIQGWRRQNEDMHDIRLSLTPTHPSQLPITFMAIYDGHVGTGAARFLHQYLPERLSRLSDPMNHGQLYDCIIQCDQEFLRPTNPARNEGSTLCFVLTQPIVRGPGSDIFGYRMTLVNVGDSRALLLDAQGTIICSTVDHKPDTEVERSRILRAGGTVSSGRVDKNLSLSRAFGDAPFKTPIGARPEELKVSVVPDIVTLDLVMPGCSLLLFCDGLVEHVSNQEIAQFVSGRLRRTPMPSWDPGTLCSELVSFGFGAGSSDNISVLMMCLVEGRGYSRDKEWYEGEDEDEAEDAVDYSLFIPRTSTSTPPVPITPMLRHPSPFPPSTPSLVHRSLASPAPVTKSVHFHEQPQVLPTTYPVNVGGPLDAPSPDAVKFPKSILKHRPV